MNTLALGQTQPLPPESFCPESGPIYLAEEQKAAISKQKWEPQSLNPRHREIMRRLLEGASNLEIAESLSISPQTIVLLRSSKLFQSELAKMEEAADFQVVKRAEALSNEALDLLKITMRKGPTASIKLRAAESILDRAGYGKIEKRVVGLVAGEEVIREINKIRRERILGESGVDNRAADEAELVSASNPKAA